MSTEKRDALAQLRYTVHGGTRFPDGVHTVGYPAADAILAAGYELPVTDAEIEELAHALGMERFEYFRDTQVPTVTDPTYWLDKSRKDVTRALRVLKQAREARDKS